MSNLQYTAKTIRGAAILTASYVAWTVIWQDDNNRIQELNQSVLYIDVTLWSLTSVELKLEYSDDGVNYYQQTFIDISGWTASASLAEYTFTADGGYIIANPFKSKYLRVSAKGSWTVTGSSCAIKGVIWIA